MSSTDKRRLSAYERFTKLKLNEKNIQNANTLSELQNALGYKYKNLSSARATKNLTLKGIEKFGVDIATSEQIIHFSDATDAKISTIELDYRNPLSESNASRILTDWNKDISKLSLSFPNDVKFYIESMYKDGKIKTAGITMTKYKSYEELELDIIECINEILMDYAEGIETFTIGFTTI